MGGGPQKHRLGLELQQVSPMGDSTKGELEIIV